MRAAFLIRCSTKKQDYSRQVKDLTTLAKKLGYENTPDIIFGEHITGKDDATKRDRLSIQHLKESINNYDVVLVSEVSRMSRDSVSGRWYVREFINMNIPIYFRDANIWTIGPNTGKVNKDAELQVGQYFDAAAKYIRSMKTQIASGRREELEKNSMSIGQPYFGYKRFGGKDKDTKNTWIINEEEAKIVSDVYNEYLKDGATLKSTSLVISNKYNRKFSVSNCEHILQNEPYYTGIKVVHLTDPDTEEVETFEVKIPTIIGEQLFKAVEAKRNTNRTTKEPYPVQTTYILSKLLKCPICGHSLTPRKRSGGIKYRMINGKIAVSWKCMAKINNVNDCDNHTSINNEKIEPVIWELVKSELIGLSNLGKDERLKKIKDIETTINNKKNDIVNFNNQIKANDNQMNRAYQLYMDAPEDAIDIIKSQYLNTLSKCKKDSDVCKNNISNLTKEIDKLQSNIEYYKHPVTDIPENNDNKRKIVTELIDKIYPFKVSSYISPSTHKKITNGVLLLEVYAVNDIYYVLLDCNEQGTTRNAYYIKKEFATYQCSKSRFSVYDEGEYFVITNASMLVDTDELEKFASFNEMIDICKANNYILTYNY